jgi:hypothetical protein
VRNYVVWNPGDARDRKTISADSELEAATVFLGVPASPVPKSIAHARRPACHVLWVPAPPQQMPPSSKRFWKA